jgi:hypothetical protein
MDYCREQANSLLIGHGDLTWSYKQHGDFAQIIRGQKRRILVQLDVRTAKERK